MNNIFEYKDYFGSAEYSETDAIFFGRIIGINDHITYEGDNLINLENDFIQAVDDYIEGCVEIGKEPEKSCIGKINIQVAPELHKKILNFSISHNKSLNKIVEDALEQYVV